MENSINAANEISQLVKLISEYGIMVVICAIMIICFIVLFRSNQKKTDQLFKTLIESLNPPKHIAHPEESQIDLLASINDQIHDRLASILTKTCSDRSYLFLYHNGGISNSGLYFQRMSCVCEVVSQGILPLSKTSQGLHQSTYKGLCKKLYKDGIYIISDAKDLIGVDDILYSEMRTRKARASILIALKNNQQQVIGFFGLDFGFDPESSQQLNIDLLKEEAHELSVLVNIKKDIE